MTNNSSNFQKNRKNEMHEQVNYWRVNIESGILRFMERIILRFNVSDVLGGDLGQILHLKEVKEQVKYRGLIESPILQKSNEEMELIHSEATLPQYIFEFQNVCVDVLTGLVVLENGFIVDSTLAKWQKIIFRGGVGSSVKRTKRSKVKIVGCLMVLPHSPYFYHILIDEIPNLIRIRDEYPHCNGVIVHTTMPSWALELLSYFQFDIHKLNEKSVVAENLLAVSAPRAIVGKNLEYLRRHIETKPEMIIVVSRKGSPRSDNEIEKEIVKRIPGAILIDPGDFTVEEQIGLFTKARAIIGLHGGALTNCVWMDKSSKVVEIFNHAYRTSDYARLCMELGIRYYGVEIESMNPAQVSRVVEGKINGI
jgi:hypothetical protein